MTSHPLPRAARPRRDVCPRQIRLDSLLVRVGDGDRDAFAALYDELVRPIHAMSVSSGHGAARTAHITFDVFLCAWLQAATYDPEVESAWSWMRAIALKTITSALEPEPNHV